MGDEQTSSGNGTPEGQGWKGKLRQLFNSKSPFAELREKLQAAIAAGTISESDDAGAAIKQMVDSLDVVELSMGCEELGLQDPLSGASTVRELLWLLKTLEIEDQRQSKG